MAGGLKAYKVLRAMVGSKVPAGPQGINSNIRNQGIIISPSTQAWGRHVKVGVLEFGQISVDFQTFSVESFGGNSHSQTYALLKYVLKLLPLCSRRAKVGSEITRVTHCLVVGGHDIQAGMHHYIHGHEIIPMTCFLQPGGADNAPGV